MAVVKLKNPQLAVVRVADLTNPSGTRTESAVGDGTFTIITDEPEERGGTNTAAAPLFHFTTSLGACQAVQIRKVAEAMRMEIGEIRIKTETTTDRIDGIDGKNKVMRFCAAELTIDLETNESEDKIERLKKISEDQCPVGNLFTDAGYEPVLHWNIHPLKG